MGETNDILNSVNKAVNTLNTVSNVTKDISTIGDSYSKRQKKKESGELEVIKLQTEIYDKKIVRLIKCGLALWLGLIIVTIVLCVTGNDIVLKFLHI